MNNVLCLSPHPDDVEYSMSGFILKNKHIKFTIICITLGEIEALKEQRRNEVINFWKDVVNVNLIFLDKYILSYDNIFFIVGEIEKLINISDYDTIFYTSNCDSHYHHLIVNNVGLALGRSSICNLIEYKSPSTLDNWVPNYFVCIDDVYSEKINRLKLFDSQKKAKYFNLNVLNGFHTYFQYLKKTNIESFIEKFKIITIYE